MMTRPSPTAPPPLNWGTICLRFLVLYLVTWLGSAAWMAHDTWPGFRACFLSAWTALVAGAWFVLLAVPFSIVTGIAEALFSRELAARWKVLVAILTAVITLEGLWLLDIAQGRAVSPVSRTTVRRFTLGPRPPSSSLDDLQRQLAPLMRGLQQYLYDLDAQTQAVLRQQGLRPRSTPAQASD